MGEGTRAGREQVVRGRREDGWEQLRGRKRRMKGVGRGSRGPSRLSVSTTGWERGAPTETTAGG